MSRFLTVLLVATALRATAVRIRAAARAGTKQLQEKPFDNPELHLTKSWRDVAVDLPPWQIHFCAYCGPGGNLSISIDDKDFGPKCEELLNAQGQSCVDLDEIMTTLPPNKWIINGKIKKEEQCKEFKKNVEQAVGGASIGRGIEIAVHLCELELPQVCNSWCETKQLLEPKPDRNCKEVCSEMVAFNTGSIACSPPLQWQDCLAAHRQRLIAAKRDPDLEAIMREMTLKCICVAKPASGEYEGHESCYKELGGGQMLSRDQKWCEWHDSPSWRRLSMKWASEKEATNGPMPLPTCTEFPRYDGK